MGWGITLLLIWAAVLTGGFLWFLARMVAKAAARKRHAVFSHMRHVYTPIEEVASEAYFVSPDGSIHQLLRPYHDTQTLDQRPSWERDEERRRGRYRG